MASKKKNLKFAEKDVLKDNESILHSIEGTYETKMLGSDTVKNGVMIATEERLVFYSGRFTGYDSESYKYENISSLDSGQRMLGKSLTFYASGNEISIKWIQDKEYDNFMDYVESRIGKKPVADTTSQKEDNLDQLKKLKELLDMDAITQEEFDAKKKQLLNI